MRLLSAVVCLFLRLPAATARAEGIAWDEGSFDDALARAAASGSRLIVDVYATWCGPCLLEIPWFSDYADGHPEVALLGIATDGPAEKVAAAAQQLEMTYPVLMSDDATHEAYGISTIPTTVIVDAEGRVRYAHSGLLMGWQLRALVWWFG